MGDFSADPQDLSRRSVARGTIYIGAAQLWRMGLSLVSAVVLARLLAPADFGLVAMVAPVVAFASLVQDMGLSQATVQRESMPPALLGALFWLNVAAGLILSVALIAVAPVLAAFYGQPELRALTIAFAAVVFLTSAQAQHLALMTRRMQFLKISVIEAVAATLGFLAGLATAYVWATYWALFAASLTTALTGAVLFWTFSGWRPGRSSFGGALREIAGFSSGLSGHAIFTYLARNLDDVLIGRYHGPVALGLYDRAYKLLLFPLNQINGPLGRVVIPLLSRLKDDRQRYLSAYSEALTYLLVLTQPAIVVLVVFAEDIFAILLGERWVAAAPIFQVLGIAGLQQIFTNTFFWLFVSQARAKQLFQLSVFRAATTCGAFVIGLPWGPFGVAAAYAASDILLRMPVQAWVVTREGPLSLRALVATLLPHLAATLAAAAAVLLVAQAWSFDLVHAVPIVAAGYAAYLAVLLAFGAKRKVFARAIRRG